MTLRERRRAVVAFEGARERLTLARLLLLWAPDARRETLGDGGARREELRDARFACVCNDARRSVQSIDEDICSSRSSSDGFTDGGAGVAPLLLKVALGVADATAGVVATAGELLSALSRCFFFDAGIESLLAYSCGPGIGGGMKEEEGEGKGEEEGGDSSDNER